jgi:dTDP-4-dehydrorhamnose reductase
VKPLEIWGGLECTLNRVGDSYVDQCDKNGHYKRLSDLKLFNSLGIRKLRYPCLWEKVAPKSLDHCDWSYLDERLGELRRLNQDFIAGFLHHGSGPLYTSLIDPDFPEKLATYARLFATRYPWVTDYTPINEINTTARFSLLYGHWYPHQQNPVMYIKALLLQCKGTILAMKEIRIVNPKARLIQTDDLGKCQSTPELNYQCEWENERRWLSWDLLCGKVTPNHPLYSWIINLGISKEELSWFEEHSTAPDVIGINHYHLSNRYLDHNLDSFPEFLRGGNGTHAYADVGAIDTGIVENISPDILFRETWERYHIPLAITECHTIGHREGQMRWLHQIWETAKSLRLDGISIEAVTAWSLLGTYDWHNLCTKTEGFYESGVFDLKNPDMIPRATALSKMIRALATEGHFESPLLDSPGTWETPRRILWGAKPGQSSSLLHPPEARPILIIGENQSLGEALAKTCGARNIRYKILSIDITNRHSIENAIAVHKPWAIINTAEDATLLALVCRNQNISLIHFCSESSNNEEHLFSIYQKSLVIKESAPSDIFISLTYASDLANECLRLLIDEEKGIIHLSNVGEKSWEQFAFNKYFTELQNQEIRQ